MSSPQTYFQVWVDDQMIGEFGSGELSAAKDLAVEKNGRVKVERR